MLITVERADVPGHIKSGWAHGLYWRIINTFDSESHSYSVYLMVLVPLAPLGLVQDDPLNGADIYVNDIPAMYVPEHGHLDVALTAVEDSELSPQLPMQWVESYYGTFYMDSKCRMQRTITNFRWSSLRKYKGPDVKVAASVFLQRMQPAAEYLCKMLRERIDPEPYAPVVISGESDAD